MESKQPIKPGSHARYAKEVDKGDLRIPLLVCEVYGDGRVLVEERVGMSINPSRTVRESDIVILDQPLPPFQVKA